MSRTSGPGELVVNAGKTRHSVASVITAANAPPLPAAWNSTTWWRTAPTSSDSPTIPLQVIITAAKTVSRASVAVCGPPEAVMLRISPTSMIVTATARISEPYGSPTRCATTSAWCTATSTAPTRTTATIGDEHRPELAVPHEHQEQQGDDGRSDGAEHGERGHGAEAVTSAQDPGAGLSPVLRSEASRVSTWNQNGAPRLAASTENRSPAITATTSCGV